MISNRKKGASGQSQRQQKHQKYNVSLCVTISSEKQANAAALRHDKNEVHHTSPDFTGLYRTSPDFTRVYWNSTVFIGIILNLIDSFDFQWTCINIHSVTFLCILPIHTPTILPSSNNTKKPQINQTAPFRTGRMPSVECARRKFHDTHTVDRSFKRL